MPISSDVLVKVFQNCSTLQVRFHWRTAFEALRPLERQGSVRDGLQLTVRKLPDATETHQVSCVVACDGAKSKRLGGEGCWEPWRRGWRRPCS